MKKNYCRLISFLALLLPLLMNITSVRAGGSLQEPRNSWEGSYIGIHGGYAWGDVDWKVYDKIPTKTGFTTEIVKILSGDIDGGIYGAHLGGLEQKNNFVYGVELSLMGGDIGASTLCPDTVSTCKVDVDWLALLSARAGYANDNWMAYVMGGLALADLTAGVSHPIFGSDSVSNLHLGWHVGAGVDYKLSSKLSLGVEYIYTDLGDESFTLAGSPENVIDYDTSVVRAKLSYKFNE